MQTLANRPVIFRNPDPVPSLIVDAIKQHAVECYPNESCGLVLTDDTYQPCVNVHSEPDKAFKIDPNVTMRAMQGVGIKAVVHSHPDGPNYPSFRDQQAQIDSDMIWGIVPVIGTDVGEQRVAVPSDILWWGDALPTPQLERRKFIWGIFHCYSLFRDWWWVEHNVRIPNFACPDDFIDAGYSVFTENFQKAGLQDIGKPDMSRLQIGDMLVGHLKGNFPNHCGIYLGGDDFLHHPSGGVSGKANLLRWWPHIDTVFRYDDGKETLPLR